MADEILFDIGVDDSDVDRAAKNLREFQRRGEELERGLASLGGTYDDSAAALRRYDAAVDLSLIHI